MTIMPKYMDKKAIKIMIYEFCVFALENTLNKGREKLEFSAKYCQ